MHWLREARPPIAGPFSIYLDLIRFLAAMAVLFGHAQQDRLYTGALPLASLSHEAVIVFFVLSGLVIANTASRPSETMRSFAIARAARIYSVAVPAVLLGLALKGFSAFALGGAIRDSFLADDLNPLKYVSTFLFLNESWWMMSEPPWNGPYWSLCYEVWYYAVFGAILFVPKTSWKLLTVLVFMLLAGPGVAVLAPLWFFGVVLSRIQPKAVLPGWVAYGLLAVTWIGVASISFSGVDVQIKTYLHDTVPGFWRLGSAQRVVTDYALGLLVMLNFLAFAFMRERAAGAILPLATPIRLAAACTFSIYLFHRPLTQFLSALFPNASGTPLLGLGLIALTLALCCGLSLVTESRKHVLRKKLQQLWPDRSAERRAERIATAA